MAIELQDVTFAPLAGVSATVPDGAVIGLVGENGAGKRQLLHLVAGLEQPVSGAVMADAPKRLLGPMDKLNFAPVKTLLLEHTLTQHDALVRGRALVGLERMRRSGTAILIISHETQVLRQLCDEVWWLHEGRIAAKGDAREVVGKYERHIAQKLRAWGETLSPTLTPVLRRGDGRAQIVSLETRDANGKPAYMLRSGEPMSVTMAIKYNDAVKDPVAGIMIRTRIGFEVYGTNTELEGVSLGEIEPGATLHFKFDFPCGLCAHEYAVTGASHDTDGVWHDWMEDAVAFKVTDDRYTAGVANLRAKVSVERG